MTINYETVFCNLILCISFWLLKSLIIFILLHNVHSLSYSSVYNEFILILFNWILNLKILYRIEVRDL